MMNIQLKVFLVTILSVFFFSGCSQGRTNVHDGFETDELSKNWSEKKLVPGALIMQSDYVHAGAKAAKITLHSDDNFDKGTATSLSNERVELLEAANLYSEEGSNYEYSFSLFLPADFPLVPTRLVIAQWKQYCPEGICEGDSPVMAIRYESGRLRIALQTDTTKINLYKTDDDIRNTWLNFKFKVKFTRQNTGEIESWLNNKQIVSYKGVTSYSEKHGYPVSSKFYFKMGLYRDSMSTPMTIYVDEYSKKLL